LLRVLLVDLNNFARYPTLPVGALAAVLRDAGHEVRVLSPLARGVKGYPRLTRAKPWGLIDDRLRYWSAVTPSRTIRRMRRAAAEAVRSSNGRDEEVIVAYASEMLEERPDVVMLSTYTMYEATCAALAKLCHQHDIPVLVGGNYFVAQQIVQRWLRIEGVTAIYSGEPENELVALAEALAAREDVSGFAGVSVPGQAVAKPAPPLRNLDELPFPDYTDFPWQRYPNHIVPIMTGRGCEWSRCRFCADVVTSAGRTFRSRSLDNVLAELRLQQARHRTSLFVFLDLKLNSDIAFWRGLLEQLPGCAPHAGWTASVHVDTRGDNGLSRDDMLQARAAGLARVTTGLETASQRLLKRMAKGTDPERTSAFLRDAAAAGISTRLTTIIGYPGEEPGDLHETARFLARNESSIERVMLNRFSLMLGANIDRLSVDRPGLFPGLRRGRLDPSTAVIEHSNSIVATPAHRQAVYDLMAAVHRINRKPLRAGAQEFEGVM
jgi:Radical SAM superfamily